MFSFVTQLSRQVRSSFSLRPITTLYQMITLTTVTQLQQYRESITGTVGFVPTMGSLHEGHFSLIRLAVANNDSTIVSIFINPIQFGPHEDFESYPRDLAYDSQQLRKLGVDCLFAPSSSKEIYPLGPDKGPFVELKLGWPTTQLEASCRPGFFRGVCTVVTKLLLLTRPTIAYFGQKDLQQLTIIRALCKYLYLPVRIESVETRRDTNGLAFSSRNSYLNDSKKALACDIYRGLLNAANNAITNMPKTELLGYIYEVWQQHVVDGQFKIDYLELCSTELEPISAVRSNCVVLCAVYVYGVRLIDNVLING